MERLETPIFERADGFVNAPEVRENTHSL